MASGVATGLSPSDTQIARVTLGKMIQQLRKSRRVTSQALGKALGWSQSKMSKVENGVAAIKEHELLRIAEILGATDRQIQQLQFRFGLTELPPLSTRALVAHGVDRHQRAIAEYERLARVIDVYCHSVVPGLLQTPDYTRALLGHFGVPERAIDPAVEERLIRQRILAHAAREFHFLLSETVLYSLVGSRDVQVEQLEALKLRALTKSIRIGIIPTASGTPPRALSEFTVFNSDFVTSETVVIEQHFSDPVDVNVFVSLHADLSSRAHYGQESAVLIDRAMSALMSQE